MLRDQLQAKREREAQEREAREKEAQDKEAQEKEARDKEAREKEAQEKEAREKQLREEQLVREREEQQAREREAQEQEARESRKRKEREEYERQEQEQVREEQARKRQRLEEQIARDQEAERLEREAQLREKQLTEKVATPAKVEDFFCEMPTTTTISPPKLAKKSSSLSLLLSRTDSLLNRTPSSSSITSETAPTTFDLELEKIEDATSTPVALPSSPVKPSEKPGYLDVASQLTEKTPVLPTRQNKRVTSPASLLAMHVKQLGNCRDGTTKIQVYRSITQFVNENESTPGLALDTLVIALASHVETALEDTQDAKATPTRVCKSLIDTLVSILGKKPLAQTLTESAASVLFKSLFSCMLNESLEMVENGAALRKQFNELMLKIMENVDRTTCFLVLLKVSCVGCRTRG